MSLATLNTLAYDTWEPGLNNQLENELGTLYGFLAKTSKNVRGRRVFIKLQTGRPTGVSNIDEGAAFPTPGDAAYAEVQLALSRPAATVEFTLDEMDMLDGTDAAALAVVDHKLSDLINTLRRDIVRQSWGDGTAKLARFVGAGPSVTQVLQATATNQIDRDRFNWLESFGMKIDILHGTTGASVATQVGITNIVESTNTLTLDTSVTTDANSVAVRSGNAIAVTGAYTSREFPGVFAAIDDDNTYLTLDRTTAAGARWKANVVYGASAGTPEPITLDRVMRLINRVTRATGLQPSARDYCFISNLGVWAAYGEYIQPGVRYQPDSTLDVGWPRLEIFGMPFYGDIHAPHSNLFFMNKPMFEYRRPKYQDRGMFQFQNKDGSMFRYVANATVDGYKAKIQSQLTGMMTLVTERPNAHGRLDDILEQGV